MTRATPKEILRKTGLLTVAATAMIALAGCGDQQDPQGAAPEQLDAPSVNEAPAAESPAAAPTDDTNN